jgi:hypothetical protein
MFIGALFTVTKIWNQLWCLPAEEKMKKMYIKFINKILSFVETWIEVEHIKFTELSQTQKDNNPMFYSR